MGFGGFGYFFSKASLERLIQPLQCTSTGDIKDDKSISAFVKNACEKLTNKGKFKDTIGEEQLFFPGMCLIEVWGKVTELKPFCLHGDLIFGYFVNFYYISRHTVHSGKNFLMITLMTSLNQGCMRSRQIVRFTFQE